MVAGMFITWVTAMGLLIGWVVINNLEDFIKAFM